MCPFSAPVVARRATHPLVFGSAALQGQQFFLRCAAAHPRAYRRPTRPLNASHSRCPQESSPKSLKSASNRAEYGAKETPKTVSRAMRNTRAAGVRCAAPAPDLAQFVCS